MSTSSSPLPKTRHSRVQAVAAKRAPEPVPTWLRWAPLYIALAAVIVYIVVLRFDFIGLDDSTIIKQRFFIIGHLSNLKLAFTTDAFLGTSGSFYRPLQTVTFMLDAAMGGKNPFVYHLTNLALHVAACLSLYWLLITLAYPRLPALALSVIYAVHPVFASAVAWVPSRGDELLTLFTLLAVGLFVRSRASRSPWPFALHGAAFFLAFLSKETAVVIPILCVMQAYLWRSNTPRTRSLLGYALLWIAVTGAWYGLRSQLRTVPSAADLGPRAFIANLQMIPETVGKFLLPFHFRLIPQYNLFDTLLGTAALAVLLAAILLTKGGFNRRVMFGLLWFVVTLAPVMAFRNFDAAYLFDYLYHRSYLTNIGLVIVLLEIVTRTLVRARRTRVLVAGAAAAAAYCGSVALAEVRFYREPLTFYNEAIARSPRSAMGYNNRGNYFADDKRQFAAAVEDFNRAIALYPGYTTAVTNRGVSYMMLGRYREALTDIEAALRTNETDPDNVFRRGELRYVLNDFPRALTDFDAVLTTNRLYPRIHSARAGCLAMLGRGNEAMVAANEALTADEKDEDAYNSRGLAKRVLGDASGAMEDFDRAIALKADAPKPYNNRGAMYFAAGQWELARGQFSKAIQLDSAYAEAYSNRGSVEQRQSRFQEALTDLNRALQINPDFADAYQNRGVVRNNLRQFASAIEDFNRSIGIRPDRSEAYLGRGIAKSYLQDQPGSCDDWKHAAALGSGDAAGLLAQYCK